MRATRVLLAMVAVLAAGARAAADELQVVDDTEVAISAKAEASATELAASLRSLGNSLRTAPPIANENKVLSAEEHDALVEAGVKAQLAGLADELELLSAALASDADPALQKALLASVNRRASSLSRLGARPARPSLPPGLHTELLALWSDVQALSATRAAPAPAADAPVEAAP